MIPKKNQTNIDKPVQFGTSAKTEVQQPQATYCTYPEPKADPFQDISDVPLVSKD